MIAEGGAPRFRDPYALAGWSSVPRCHGVLTPGIVGQIARRDGQFWAVLDSLRESDSWWETALALPSEPQSRPKRAPWLKAIGAALVLHGMALTATLLVRPEGSSTVSPGTSSAIQVLMLPAWPRTGDRTVQLGTTAAKPGPIRTASVRAPSRKPVRWPAAPIATVPTQAIFHVDSVPQPRPSSPRTLARSSEAPVDRKAPSSSPQNLQQASEASADRRPSVPNPALRVWEQDVITRLSALKRYPARALRLGLEDTVMVRFVVNQAGEVLSVEIAQSRGVASLDEEARRLLLRVSPLPMLPAGADAEMQFVVPIAFSLRQAA